MLVGRVQTIVGRTSVSAAGNPADGYDRVPVMRREGSPDPAPLIDCPSCTGMGFLISDCSCRLGGDQFEVDDQLVGAPDGRRAAWSGCEVCGGQGSITEPCRVCRQSGKVRAQVVFTVVNTDTGQVASTALTGQLLPSLPCREPSGLWTVDLVPVVADLAARVDAAILYTELGEPALRRTTSGRYELLAPDSLYEPPRWTLPMPHPYFPDLPPGQLSSLADQAIAEYGGTERWRIWRGTATAPTAHDDPDQVLARLTSLADALCVDLIVEVRSAEPTPDALEIRQYWNVRLQLPDAAVPPDVPQSNSNHGNLAVVLAATRLEDLLDDLANSDPTAPAYWIRTDTESAVRSPCPGQVADLQARLVHLAADSPDAGAIATWRNRTWHLARLVPVDTREELSELATGQISTYTTKVVDRDRPLPAPDWVTGPIEQTPCPTCRTGTAWIPCACRYDGIDPACPRCRGAGTYAADVCPGCGGTRAVRHGLVVTITDGTQVQHTTWTADGAIDTALSDRVSGGGTPTALLPSRYRISHLAQQFGTDRDHLVDSCHAAAFTGWCVSPIGDPDILEGRVPVTSLAEAAGRYLAMAGIGRSGGRLILRTGHTAAYSTENLVAIILALGFHADINTRTWLPPGAGSFTQRVRLWSSSVLPSDSDLTDNCPLMATDWHHTLAQATTTGSRDLTGLWRLLTPDDPTALLAVPQHPIPLRVELPDPAGYLRRVALHYAGWRGEAVTARFTPTDCHLLLETSIANTSDTDMLHRQQSTLLGVLASAPTLAEAVTKLPLNRPDDQN